MSISVCIATYNGSNYIREQLESILKQIGDGDEIIVSDDKSTDHTIDIVSSLKSDKIKIVQGPGVGLVKNFENALSYAQNDIVFLCDQDDIWYENKVSRYVDHLSTDAVDLVISDCHVVDAKGEILHNSFFLTRNSKAGFWRNLFKNRFLGCCMAFKRKTLPFFLPFPDNIPMHDWWIGLVITLKGRVLFLEEPLMAYRRHGNNASPTGEQSNNSGFIKFKHRFNLLICLFCRGLRWLPKK